MVPTGDRGRGVPGRRPLSAGRQPAPAALASLLLLAFPFVASSARGDDGVPLSAPASPPRRAEDVTVTATREETRVKDAPASLAVLPRDALDATAAPTVDEALRQVVGFSLFRRAGSRYANPTTQGVSLRGLGASGASRALVLQDGLPQNDAFGGWVYWSRLPRAAIERIEVQRGGASDLYGSSALGGVVQVLTRDTGASPRVVADVSAGGLSTFDASVSAAVGRGEWRARLAAQAFGTEGYVAVEERSRGPVDTELASRHAGADLLVERRLGGGRLFARVSGFGEARENATPLQTNETRQLAGALGADLGAAGGPRWSARLWGQGQLYEQVFSAVSSDRTREERTRDQRVPADVLGFSAQHARTLGARHRLVAGVEAAATDGTTEETVYVRDAPSSRLEAGGAVRSVAVFAGDLVQVAPRVLATASLRLDGWHHRDGRTTTAPISGGPGTTTTYEDRSETALSPRLGLLIRASPAWTLVASGYGAFRGPTLNELYRSFRVGDTLTLANPELRAERLWGGEAGLRLAAGPVRGRLTAFGSSLEDAVANVTVVAAPALVTRQRRNVARVRARGVEAEAEWLAGRAVITAGYAFTDSRVASFPGEPALEGRRVPQVPRHQATMQARYDSPWRVGLQVRWASEAWDDDRNTLALDPALQVDLLAGRDLGRGLELYVAAENLLDEEIVVARTPVASLAPPRTVRVGLRFRGF